MTSGRACSNIAPLNKKITLLSPHLSLHKTSKGTFLSMFTFSALVEHREGRYDMV